MLGTTSMAVHISDTHRVPRWYVHLSLLVLTAEAVFTGGRFGMFDECVRLRATEWIQPLVVSPNCETLLEAGAQRGMQPGLPNCEMAPHAQLATVSTMKAS